MKRYAFEIWQEWKKQKHEKSLRVEYTLGLSTFYICKQNKLLQKNNTLDRQEWVILDQLLMNVFYLHNLKVIHISREFFVSKSNKWILRITWNPEPNELTTNMSSNFPYTNQITTKVKRQLRILTNQCNFSKAVKKRTLRWVTASIKTYSCSVKQVKVNLPFFFPYHFPEICLALGYLPW